MCAQNLAGHADHAFPPSAAMFAVSCGSVRRAWLDPQRLGPEGGRSRCIQHDGHWISLSELEALGGRGQSQHWKRSVKHRGKALHYWIARGLIPAHRLRAGSEGGSCSPDEDGQNTRTPSPLQADENMSGGESHCSTPGGSASTTGSDSGVSLSNQQADEQADYLAMTQEALVALAKGNDNGGASQINVLLYILNKFKPKEEVLHV